MGVRRTVLDPNEDQLPYLATVTLGAKAKGRAVITCDEAYECFTHFVGGRTLPCLEPECACCTAERPKRYEGFISLIWIVGRRHQLVRMTRNAMMQLKSQTTPSSSLRGRVVLLERKGGRSNGRVEVLVEPETIEVSRLPAKPDLEAHLARIWRVDGLDVTKDERAYVRQLSAFTEESIAKGRAQNAS